MTRSHRPGRPKKHNLHAGQRPVDCDYPSVSRWVQSHGWIEIGIQELFGFVAVALHEGGTAFRTDEPTTLVEAMAALEQGLREWFAEQGEAIE